jgi:hypothetical protein
LGAAVAVAVMRRKERELREAFFSSGAIQPIGARSLSDLGVEENMTWKRLCRRSVIREATPGLFYWDEDVWQAMRAMRLRMGLMMIGAIILVGIMIAYGSARLQ